MTSMKGKIQFEHKGIGEVLLAKRLKVPTNQREYSWKEEHVRALMEDFATAISQGPVTYFLGTIVLTSSDSNDTPEVADGQQRLATTTMILAGIRDHFYVNDQSLRAQSLQNYLGEIDTESEANVPKLRLNIDDADFFNKRVLLNPDHPDRLNVTAAKTRNESHQRISEAAEFVKQYITTMLTQRNASTHASVLIEWKNFITNDAQVIQLIVPDHLNAFVMFETLNDRGLKASEADLLKNYLFKLAGDRIDEAHLHWAKMLGILESLGRDDVLMDYLRHTTICQFGPTIAKEVYDKMRKSIASETRSLEFLEELATGAPEYSALFNPSHSIWNKYAPSTRRHLRILLDLRVEQVRALMLAVLRHFEVAETDKAMKVFVAWSVRFLIAGGGRGGVLDTAYGNLAASVTKGSIKDSYALVDAMKDTVPTDAVFQAAFAEVRVSQSHLARYYLRALEQQAKGLDNPELIPNDDESINLEHILPQSPGPKWGVDIDPDVAAAYYKRLGNMALLQAKKNVNIGNERYPEKQPTLAASAFVLTAETGAHTQWGVPEITTRQKRLAELAVRTWSIATTKPTKGGKLPKAKMKPIPSVLSKRGRT